MLLFLQTSLLIRFQTPVSALKINRLLFLAKVSWFLEEFKDTSEWTLHLPQAPAKQTFWVGFLWDMKHYESKMAFR